MKPHELEIVKQELGLAGIDDPEELRTAIQQKLSSMNALDRFSFHANIGRKVKEAEARLPGEKYAITSGAAWTATVLCLVMSAAAVLAIVITEISTGFKTCSRTVVRFRSTGSSGRVSVRVSRGTSSVASGSRTRTLR